MAMVPKPNQQTDLSSTRAVDILASEVSIDRLLEDGLLTLHREMKNLMIKSVKGKLEASDARDLRDHLKLLFELKDRENAKLRAMTDDQLKAAAEEALREPSETP